MEIFLPKNIKYLRTTQGISQADLGSKLKPTKAHTSIGNWENGKAEPSFGEVNALARIFDITASELLFTDIEGSESENNSSDDVPVVEENQIIEYRLKSGSEQAETKLEVAKRALREIELFYREPGEPNVYDLDTPAAAGRAITLLEEDKVRIKPNLYLPGLGPGIHIRMPVSGNSMSPTIKHEDKIVGTWTEGRSTALKEGKAYIIIDMDDDVVVKRVFFETGKYFRLVSDNNIVAPYPMSTDNVRGAFLVRQIHRSDIDPDDSEIMTEFRRIRSEWATFQALYSSKLNDL